MLDLDFDQYVPSRMLLSAVGGAGVLTPQASKEVQRSEFVVTSYRIVAFLNATNGSNPTGTPLPYNTVTSPAGIVSAYLITAQLQLSDVVVFDAPTPLPLWGGYGDQDEILTEPWRLPVKRNITLQVVNGTGVAGITTQLLLKGYKKLRG